MATVTIDIDLPTGVTVTGYERHGDGHGFEVSWPLPDLCRCDLCGREDKADIEYLDRVQVVRDLDLLGQPTFWIYQPAFHRCGWCNHRQWFIPPFKRKDTSYTFRLPTGEALEFLQDVRRGLERRLAPLDQPFHGASWC